MGNCILLKVWEQFREINVGKYRLLFSTFLSIIYMKKVLVYIHIKTFSHFHINTDTSGSKSQTTTVYFPI